MQLNYNLCTIYADWQVGSRTLDAVLRSLADGRSGSPQCGRPSAAASVVGGTLISTKNTERQQQCSLLDPQLCWSFLSYCVLTSAALWQRDLCAFRWSVINLQAPGDVPTFSTYPCCFPSLLSRNVVGLPPTKPPPNT